MAKEQKKSDIPKRLPPMAGGAPNSCIEIDAEEFSAAQRDPAVRRLLDRADQYAENLKVQERLQTFRD